MTEIQAIVLDLDGTLLDRHKSISPRNYSAVKRCYDSGIHIIVATARPPRIAEQFVQSLPFVDYLVFYNGALVKCKSKQTQQHISIPIEVSEQINEFMRLNEPQSTISYEVNDLWYTCTPVPETESAQFGARSNDAQPQVVDYDFIRSISPTKILALGYSNWRDVSQRFGDQVNVIATDGEVLVQIMHKSASKENAVKSVLNDIGVNPEMSWCSEMILTIWDFSRCAVFRSQWGMG
ncbi:hypothetical protein FHS18_003044 [Paenibacillus phyllosphaerae]|uniref:Uncharacterized protein n=1 Tax=Paenibacillus phyllosphaerae TaxID=274593 RepID=A0A7W5AZM0_9BACL|nr:hypothetical protein [Paenibacillus phyllosphaerae]